MEFRLLGPVAIWASGRSFPVGEPRQQAVLAALLIDAGRTVSVDALVDRVWGDAPPRQVRRSLHAHLARLRRAIEQAAGAEGGSADDVLARGAGGYLLDVDPDRVDLLRFRAVLAHCRTTGVADDVRAAGLREALELWTGEPLAGVGGAWAGRVRRALRQEHTEATVLWARAEIRTGNEAATVGPLTDLADEHPLLEVGAATLMRALYAAGRSAEALAQYDRIRQNLREELGADPGPELREVHRDVLRHDSAAVIGVPPARPRRPPPAQLPGDVAAFTGRAGELAELDLLLGDADPPAPVIVCLAGTAGVGKTALAVHWGHRIRDRFPDGQLYLDLRGYDPEAPVPPADALASLLTALTSGGSELPLGLEERAALYRTEIAGRRMLIVLDNAATVEQVRPLLPGTATSVTVVTSRDSLGGLVALHGARRVSLDRLPVPDAVDLLRRLIGARVDADPAAAGELAERCVRLPLTLRLAAELAGSRPLATLADLVAELDELQRRLDLLSGGGDRKAAIRAVFSWSIQHLSPRAAEAFAVLGVHPAPTFDAHCLSALLDGDIDEVRRLLDTLARAHLVHPAGPERYGMHDLLRAYAAHLTTGPAARPHPIDVDAGAALGRLHDYYLATAALAMERLHPGESDRRPPVPASATPAPALTDAAAARTWLDAELANLESIAAHSAAHGWPAHTVRLSAILFRYLDGGHDTAALNIHGQARTAARTIGDRAGEAYALNAIGAMHTQAGRHELAAAQLWEAYTLFVEEDDQVGQARALGNLGSVDERAGRYGSAADHYAQALDRYRTTGDSTGQAHALTRLGTVEARLGRDDAALDHLRRALSLHQRAGHRFGEAWALTSLGEVEAGAGRLRRAADLHGQALTLFRQLGHRTSEAWALDGLGTTETLRGHHEQATHLHHQALTLFRENGDRDGEAWSLNGLGEAARAAGQPQQSQSHHAEALVLALQTGANDQQARAHLGLARARLTTNPTAARHHYEQAATIYTTLGMTTADTIRTELTTLDNPAPTP